MNIIFLDIDGVVATPLVSLAYPENGKVWTIDPTLMRAVANLAKEMEAKLVISSTWRIKHSFLSFHDLLNAYGAGRYLYNERNPNDEKSEWDVNEPEWRTRRERFSEYYRGYQIKDWIEKCEEQRHPVDNYVILDDDSDMLDEQKPHFVKTDGMIGLTYKDYRMARAILGGELELDDDDES